MRTSFSSRLRAIAVLAAVIIAPGLVRADIAADQVAFFESKVRPILVEHCYKCHSTESGKSKGGLLLDTRSALLKGGDNGVSIVPGAPDDSLLIKAVRWSDPDVKMPPKKKLTAAQIEHLETWVKMGAPDPRTQTQLTRIEQLIADAKTHWAFQPLAAPGAPPVKDTSWPRSEIDRFILAGLDSRGLKPSPEAD